MPIDSQTAYDEAKAEVRAASRAYYGEGDILMSDSDYDMLLADVARAEAEHPEWVTDAVSTAVAAGALPGGDVAHDIPMLSLDNVYSPDEFTAWAHGVLARTDCSFVVEPKLDGLAIGVDYRDGVPWRAVTRGDGRTGEDVSFALVAIENLPRQADGFTGQVRGEVIFTREQFERANLLREQHGDRPFVNARNGAAGALRGAKDRGYTIPLSFFAYDTTEPGHASHTDAIQNLARRGFAVAADIGPAAGSVDTDTALRMIEDFQSRLDTLPVECDGIVVKVNGAASRQSLGFSSRAPRWAVAYKYPAEEVTSVLRDVHWQVGRTGVITPRAQIDPVFVGGTTITYATLHNPDDLARKGFMIGDVVLVKRAGEVIPRLEAPLAARRDGSQRAIVPPANCPRCGGAIDRSQARWRCVQGRACGLAEAIAYAVSRDALDIDGLGKVQVGNLVASEAFIDVASIFETGTAANILIADGGVAPANAPKIVAQIETAKQASLARVLVALSIQGTGRSLCRTLASHFGSMDALRAATVEQLAQVDKIGPVKAELIAEQLTDLAAVIDRMAAAGVLMCKHGYTEPVTGTSMGHPISLDETPLAGMTVVVTGTMTGSLAGLSRNDVNDLIARHGGKPSGSVSKATTLLVVGEGAGSKLAKATGLGVQIVTEAEFAALIGKDSVQHHLSER